MIAEPPTGLAATEPLVLQVEATANSVQLSLNIPLDLLYFRGHFPARPILPGVVQIDWVLNFAQRYFSLSNVAAHSLQVKFRRLIQPGDRLLLTLTYRSTRRQIEFSYADSKGLLSSGRIGLEPE